MDSFQLFCFVVVFVFSSERIPPRIHRLILRAGVKQQSLGEGGIAEFRFVEFYLQSSCSSHKAVLHIWKSSRAVICGEGLTYECTFYITDSGFSVF